MSRSEIGHPPMTRNAVDYEEDFFAWTVEQARLLRGGELSAIDAANIAEEIESMGRSDRRELRSRLDCRADPPAEVVSSTKCAIDELGRNNPRAATSNRANCRRFTEPSTVYYRGSSAVLQRRA